MLDLRKRITLLYLPHLVISIGFIGLYSIINWFFIIRLNVGVDDRLVNVVLPCVFSWIIMMVWFNSAIKAFFSDYKPLMFFLRLFTILTFTAPTACFQYYLSFTLGDLTKLDNIKQITEHKKTRYYLLKNHYIDTKNFGVFSQRTHYPKTKYGRGGDEVIDFYVVFPIFVNKHELVHSSPVAWLAKSYSISFRDTASNKNIAELFLELREQFKKDVRTIDQFIYLEQAEHSSDFSVFQMATHKSSKYDGNDEFILYGINKPFEQRAKDIIPGGVILFVFLNGLWLYLFYEFDEKQLVQFENIKRRKLKMQGRI